jgi:hypothetical protein
MITSECDKLLLGQETAHHTIADRKITVVSNFMSSAAQSAQAYRAVVAEIIGKSPNQPPPTPAFWPFDLLTIPPDEKSTLGFF